MRRQGLRRRVRLQIGVYTSPHCREWTRGASGEQHVSIFYSDDHVYTASERPARDPSPAPPPSTASSAPLARSPMTCTCDEGGGE